MGKKKRWDRFCAVSCWTLWGWHPSHQTGVTADKRYYFLCAFYYFLLQPRCICKAAFARWVTSRNASKTTRTRWQLLELGREKGRASSSHRWCASNKSFNRLLAVLPTGRRDFQWRSRAYSKHGKSKRCVFTTVQIDKNLHAGMRWKQDLLLLWKESSHNITQLHQWLEAFFLNRGQTVIVHAFRVYLPKTCSNLSMTNLRERECTHPSLLFACNSLSLPRACCNQWTVIRGMKRSICNTTESDIYTYTVLKFKECTHAAINPNARQLGQAYRRDCLLSEKSISCLCSVNSWLHWG